MPFRLICYQLSGEIYFNSVSGMFRPPRFNCVARAVEIDHVPVYDRADDEVEPGCAEGLALERTIANFASLMEEHGALELVCCFALVGAGLAACRA